MKDEKPQTAATPRLNVYQRIAAVMSDVAYLQKDSEVAKQYKALSIEAFISHIRVACLRHGIVIVPSNQNAFVRHLPGFTKKTNSDGVVWKNADAFRTEAYLTMRVVNVDVPEDFVELTTFGVGLDENDKDSGKALSYAFKHGLMKLFMIETGETERSPYAPPPEVETISGEKFSILRKLAESAKLSEEKLCSSVGVEKLEDFPEAKFDETVAALNQRIDRIKEKETKKDKHNTGPESLPLPRPPVV